MQWAAVARPAQWVVLRVALVELPVECKAAVARRAVVPPAAAKAAQPVVVECKAVVLQAAVAPRVEPALKVADLQVAGSRRPGALPVAAARAVEQ